MLYWPMMVRRRKNLTLREIAELAGTSKSTVSRVLTNHSSVSPETRARVQKVIEERGYQPNFFARGLAGGPTGLVAVLVPEINSGFYAEVLRGMDDVASKNMAHLLTSIAHGADDLFDLWRSFCREGRADGVVVVAPPRAFFRKGIRKLELPAVLCAARPPEGAQRWQAVDSVTVDNEKGFTALLHHLVQIGCRSFIHVAGPQDVFDGQERRNAFEKFMEAHVNLSGQVIEAGFNPEDGLHAAESYLERSDVVPDAFVCFNDSTAYGVLESLRRRKLEAGRDVMVTGCDDEPAAQSLGLTSLRMPMREMGRECSRLLLERIRVRNREIPPRNIVFGLELQIRSSSLGHRRNRW